MPNAEQTEGVGTSSAFSAPPLPDRFAGLRKAARIGYQISTCEIQALLDAYDDLTADRDSWREQASARAADAVRFMQERDALQEQLDNVKQIVVAAIAGRT